MALAQDETPITNLQQLIMLTQSENLSMHHLKVQQGLYDHHYILLGHKWENQACEIIHYTGNFHTALGLTGIGIAQRDRYTGPQFQADINKGLYMINNTVYPRNSEDIATAWGRWLGREGERRYYVSSNNCENLVAYVLTGVSHSEQWTVAGISRRAFGDTIDILICEWKESLLKGIASILMSPFIRRHSKAFATELSTNLNRRSWASRVTARIRRMFQHSPTLSPPNILKNFIQRFTKEHEIQPIEILYNERFMYDISIQFLSLCVKTVGYSFLFSVLLESISIMSIIKLWNDERRGRIPRPVFKRELVKRMIAMLCAIAGTVLGCLLGFLISTSVWNGPCALGFLGNILFRLHGTITAGAAVDWVRIG